MITRVMFGAMSNGAGFYNTLRVSDTLHNKFFHMQEEMRKEGAVTNAIFMSYTTMDRNMNFLSTPTTLKEIVERLDLACAETRDIVMEEGAGKLGTSMARLHQAAEFFTNWYHAQDKRILDVVEKAWTPQISRLLFQSMDPKTWPKNERLGFDRH